MTVNLFARRRLFLHRTSADSQLFPQFSRRSLSSKFYWRYWLDSLHRRRLPPCLGACWFWVFFGRLKQELRFSIAAATFEISSPTGATQPACSEVQSPEWGTRITWTHD
jgi:hypothetical protein